MSALKLGLMADNRIQLSKLEELAEAAEYTDYESVNGGAELPEDLPEVDLWLVRIGDDSPRAQEVLDLLEHLEVPVVYDDPDIYAELNKKDQAKRFAKEVSASMLRPADTPTDRSRASKVWVLAGSAGGPEAVLDFIRLIPDDISDVAFIYAQHIDEVMTASLLRTMSRQTSWRVFYGNEVHQLMERCIYMLSPSRQVEFDSVGNLVPQDQPWDGPYGPSIDQVLAKVARSYGKRCGAIIFSGMGNDGAQACRLVVHSGGQVWAQSSLTCAVDSMPQEARNTRCVTYVGSPKDLARRFAVLNRGHGQVSCA